jgi:hypothetical protein
MELMRVKLNVPPVSVTGPALTHPDNAIDPVAVAGEMVAVYVIHCPKTAGFAELVTVVVVLWLVSENVAESDPTFAVTL